MIMKTAALLGLAACLLAGLSVTLQIQFGSMGMFNTPFQNAPQGAGTAVQYALPMLLLLAAITFGVFFIHAWFSGSGQKS